MTKHTCKSEGHIKSAGRGIWGANTGGVMGFWQGLEPHCTGFTGSMVHFGQANATHGVAAYSAMAIVRWLAGQYWQECATAELNMHRYPLSCHHNAEIMARQIRCHDRFA